MNIEDTPMISDGMGFTCESPSDIYLDIINEILKRGHVVSPRGMETKELTRCMSITRNPMKRLVLVPNRKINPFFLVAEAIWILAGRADSEYIIQFNKGLARFLDKGNPFFHAPYGERIRRHYQSCQLDGVHLYSKGLDFYMHWIDQVVTVVETLKKDPDSRRAVICLWDPYLDTKESNDIPCNDMVFFKIRENKLHMTVINRSNDAILGFPVTNLFQFSMLMELIANLLGVEMGTYCQWSDNLHIYTDQKIVDELLSVEYPPWYRSPVVPMRKMSVGAKENTLETYDKIFKSLLDITAKWDVEYIDNNFPLSLGSLRDFAYYIKCFLSYKEKNYLAARKSLGLVQDFNLYLAGLEFMHRAIKDPEGQVIFGLESNWTSVTQRLVNVNIIYDNVPEIILQSAKFFLEPSIIHE
jgi:thymidylate synthase